MEDEVVISKERRKKSNNRGRKIREIREKEGTLR